MSLLHQVHPKIKGSPMEKKLQALFPGNEKTQALYARLRLRRGGLKEAMALLGQSYGSYRQQVAKIENIEAKNDLIESTIIKMQGLLVEKYGE